MKSIVFIDTEISFDGKIQDLGAISHDSMIFHGPSINKFVDFVSQYDYICGHNVLKHDLKYIKSSLKKSTHVFIDTLYLSPLLFPRKPYHNLVKDDKLITDELNNPVSDSKKAMQLFKEELKQFYDIDENLREIYYGLLHSTDEFFGFFHYANFKSKNGSLEELIKSHFKLKICEHAPLDDMIKDNSIELAYALAIINHVNDSLTPPWVLMNYPKVEDIIHRLRNTPCGLECNYCSEYLDEKKALYRLFGFDNFKDFDGLPLQQYAVKSALYNKSLLAVFPTGGGKSLAFQLPAIMAGENETGLTVVISPLQSLMKDQVDNLSNKDHNIAVTINGMLDPLERAQSIQSVEDGKASMLYISPEMLRSKTIETLLLKRNVVRFVIDEAHCFSSWGHDFRVDYLYIGDFIKNIQDKKGNMKHIPISCFTATAKRDVIIDIKNYFRSKLSIELEEFVANTERKNLTFHVKKCIGDQEKYQYLKLLLSDRSKPTIIYVSRTRECKELSDKLNAVGYQTTYFHGKLEKEEKVHNQNQFMSGEVPIIVATSAFGMGVDKENVLNVIHYDISDSLENYTQEAGRAGRKEELKADCFILFDEDDLNKHFQLLNQSKISMQEIQQVWKAIKELTKQRHTTVSSALEIARAAGWDDSVYDVETRVRTAISALEQSLYLKREQNQPRIYANSLVVKSMIEAVEMIEKAEIIDSDKAIAKRIVQKLISYKYTLRNKLGDGETRIDYIADSLGYERADVARVVILLKEAGILENNTDLTSYVKKSSTRLKLYNIIEKFYKIENLFHQVITEERKLYNLKEMIEIVHLEDNNICINDLKQMIGYYETQKIIQKEHTGVKNSFFLNWTQDIDQLMKKKELRYRLSKSIADFLINNLKKDHSNTDNIRIDYSFKDIKEYFEHNLFNESISYDNIQATLYYMKKIGCIQIDGAFLVLYNAMFITRLENDYKHNYNKKDYEKLENFYKNRNEQIHIVAQYAKKVIQNYKDALAFSNDYFTLDYNVFLNKYFARNLNELKIPLTQAKYLQLFGELSLQQNEIIRDKDSKYIVVAAGPGSGKTKLLVHKLASLSLMEDVKYEQMLMLTFSRAAVVEFKKRLIQLIDETAHYIQITTFHSYCFELLEKMGSLNNLETVIKDAVRKINDNEVDLSRITKTVLVIDEAQDMSDESFSLVQALISKNENIRVIAVGDDDQNIYEFGGSNSKYFESMLSLENSKKYELIDNYRSLNNLVDLSNQYINSVSNRLKSLPIIAKDKRDGNIKIIKYSSNKLTIPVVRELISSDLKGSIGVLAQTNEDALKINGLLNKEGIRSKIIQSNEGFNLVNLLEIRNFITYLIESQCDYIITNHDMDNAIKRLKREHQYSSNLSGCLKLIDDFKSTNNAYYLSELTQFFNESRSEDFFYQNDNDIIISTIHQSKGREFDNVIMLLNQSRVLSDADKRVIYVGMTRAKKTLTIHDANNYITDVFVNSMETFLDNNQYEDPNEISIMLTHKDVALSDFAFRQNIVNDLYSGLEVEVSYDGCYYRKKQFLRFSKEFTNKIDQLENRNYIPMKAMVKNIVYWSNKESNIEHKIVLPVIEFCRANKC